MVPRNDRVVLFGEAGTALAAAACLRRHRVTIVSAAGEPRLASASRFVASRVRVRSHSAAEAAAALAPGTPSRDTYLFPCTDHWLEALAEDLATTLRIGHLLPAQRDHLSMTLDKAAFERAMAATGLPHPRTFSRRVTAGWTPHEYPLVMKPASTYRLEARFGVKAVLVGSAEEWASLDRRLLDDAAFLAQEYVPGRSISVCFCTTGRGRLAASYATEKIHYGSMRTGSRVAVVNRPDAIALAARFVRETGFRGFGELEMVDSSRGLLLLELNARPWSQILMCEALGAPILDLAIELMSGAELAELAPAVEPLEWMAWDSDWLFRRALRRRGLPIRPSTARRTVYAQSFLRDPIPALIYACTMSRVGPGRFLRRT